MSAAYLCAGGVSGKEDEARCSSVRLKGDKKFLRKRIHALAQENLQALENAIGKEGYLEPGWKGGKIKC